MDRVQEVQVGRGNSHRTSGSDSLPRNLRKDLHGEHSHAVFDSLFEASLV